MDRLSGSLTEKTTTFRDYTYYTPDIDPLNQEPKPQEYLPDGLAYFHLDHLGTPIEMTDQTGNTVWEASYKAWGEVETVSGSLKQPFRFQGQYFDEESGLHYNRFRYYDPSSGRFVSQDPIGLLGGGNLYAYVDNPNQWVDKLGLCQVQPKSFSAPLLLKRALYRQGFKKGSQYPARFKEKWTAGEYDYEVRIHGPDPNAPQGSTSRTTTIYRVARRRHGTDCKTKQGYGWEYGDASGNWYSNSFLKTANVNPAANKAADLTHIKLPSGIIQ